MKILVGDFETTVYEGQEFTEVWAAACVELNTEDVKIFHSIGDMFNYILTLDDNRIVIYFHNLKFDGSFWLNYLLTDLKFNLGGRHENEMVDSFVWDKVRDMKNHSLQYVISSMGQWYKVTIKEQGKIIELRDSLKLLPFKLKQIGKSFNTKHQKLDMEYEGYRYAGCEITEEEAEYIKNDVLVIKEALEICFERGHNKLTIGGCCLSEFRSGYDNKKYNFLFPNLYKEFIDMRDYEQDTAGDYIRKAYRGGWCYVVGEKKNKLFYNGCTLDVNSLYPSVMHSASGNKYPVGKPTFWKGNYIPDEAVSEEKYFFIRFKCRFFLKEDKLPMVQIKDSFLYNGREMLLHSDYINPRDGSRHTYLIKDGEKIICRPTLTMTQTDFRLFLDHYYVMDFEILSGCWFEARAGLFDEYLNKYKEIKMRSKDAERELAKLYLNNLYGKMASSPQADYKVAYIKENGALGFYNVYNGTKSAGYIPIGCAITSYARCFTITAAQENFYGYEEQGFIYADTDSIHCDLPVEEIQGVEFDDADFLKWKLESEWSVGKFIRPKSYVERVIKEKGKEVEPYYNIKCAGMGERSKELLRLALSKEKYDPKDFNETELKFLDHDTTLDDFAVGLAIPSKLAPKQIKGGVVLTEVPFIIRK